MSSTAVEAGVSPAKKLNGADGISDIEGKASRVEASERGQRMSFNQYHYATLDFAIVAADADCGVAAPNCRCFPGFLGS
jgi:hypothetical protein